MCCHVIPQPDGRGWTELIPRPDGRGWTELIPHPDGWGWTELIPHPDGWGWTELIPHPDGWGWSRSVIDSNRREPAHRRPSPRLSRSPARENPCRWWDFAPRWSTPSFQMTPRAPRSRDGRRLRILPRAPDPRGSRPEGDRPAFCESASWSGASFSECCRP